MINGLQLIRLSKTPKLFTPSESFSVNQDILQRLAEVLEQRKQADAKSS